PEAAYFGGPIAPWYEEPPPAWLAADLRSFEGMLVIRDLGAGERPLREDEHPFAANMAFRREGFGRCSFGARLVQAGARSLSGEETGLLAALQRRGRQGVWVPAAKVQHWVPAKRMTHGYLWSHFHGYGRTLVRLEGQPSGPLLWGAPRWMVRRYWELRARCCWQRLWRRRGWPATYGAVAQMAGMIDE